MRRIDAAMLGARLLALSFIVFGLTALIGSTYSLVDGGWRSFDRLTFVTLITAAAPFIGGIVLWFFSASFAIGMELDATILEQDDDEEDADDEPLDDQDTSDSDGTFVPQSTRAGADFLMIGSVLLGFWVLSSSLPAVVSAIAGIAWRPSGSLYSGGLDPIHRQDWLALIYSSVRTVFGIALIAGRQRVGAVVERLRYAPAHPPSHDDLPE